MRSSDTESKRELIRRLTGNTKGELPTWRPKIVSYAKFPPTPATTVGPTQGPSALPRSARPASFESWESLLAWTVDKGHADSGFVVNSEGFVIANWGSDNSDRWDGLGADLCLAFDEMERADQDGGRLGAICLKFEKHWLVGIRPSTSSQSAFTLGLIISALDPTFVDGCIAAITSSLEFLH